MLSVGLVYVAIFLLLVLALAGLVAVFLNVLAAFGGGFGNRARASGTFQGDDERLATACMAAFRALGALAVTREGPGLALLARRGPSPRSPGEELLVRVARADADGWRTVEIESRSGIPGTRIDWGQNQRNVAAFLDLLGRDLPRRTQ